MHANNRHDGEIGAGMYMHIWVWAVEQDQLYETGEAPEVFLTSLRNSANACALAAKTERLNLCPHRIL